MQDDLRVIQATGEYVVVEKPPGLLSVPGKGPGKEDCVALRVRGRFPGADGPLIVHRLDMDTSGLLVLGLTAGAQRALSWQFERRVVEKRYIALVDGLPEREEGVIELAMRADLARRPLQIHDPIEGRAAVTGYRVLAYETDRARVEFRPVTGRAHQLRLHAAYWRPQGLGCPILGDVLYGRALGEPVGGAARLMLHATALSFADPVTGSRVSFESAAPF